MKLIFLFTGVIILFLLSCNKKQHTKEEIESAMKLYDHLIQKVDGDSIALLYTPDGDLGTMAHGRDSIRKFLASFKNVRVLVQSSVTDSIEINADTAIQKGSYHQIALINEKDTANVKGSYKAKWVWIDKEGWRIKKMETKSAN